MDIKTPKYVRDIDEGTIDTEELKQQGYDGIIVYSFEEYPESVRENDPYVKETIEEAKGYKNPWWQLKNYNDEVVGRKYIDEVIVFEPNQIKSVYNRGSFSRTTNGRQNSLQFHLLFINIHQTIHNIHYATKVSDVKIGVHSIDIYILFLFSLSECMSKTTSFSISIYIFPSSSYIFLFDHKKPFRRCRNANIIWLFGLEILCNNLPRFGFHNRPPNVPLPSFYAMQMT